MSYFEPHLLANEIFGGVIVFYLVPLLDEIPGRKCRRGFGERYRGFEAFEESHHKFPGVRWLLARIRAWAAKAPPSI